MAINFESIGDFKSELASSDSIVDLQAVKIKYLGKKGSISLLNKELGSQTAESRKELGEKITFIRDSFEELYLDRFNNLKKQEMDQKLNSDCIDVTLSGFPFIKGSKHPISLVYEEVAEIFLSAGYAIATGPEIEDDFHNFEALNMPKSHPARDMQDTFYIHDDIILRTHTSPVQIRTMQTQKPPIKVIAPGKTYRADYDVTHTPMFHQIEGLVVDKGITFGDLKGALRLFVSKFFGDDLPIRLRPSYFPFTEPSAEVDMGCVHCRGKGCRMCKGTGFIEIAGCGMIDPNVFKAVGIDSNIYSGFAFGMGLERMALLKYGIEDIRLFYENSLKFLKQF